MLRFGIISEIDSAKGVARVKFEEDDIVSDWLRISVPNASTNKDESWYDVNEPVWCMMDEHAETGVIGGSYYHEGNQPPIGDKDTRGITFSDGTKVSYNRSSHELMIDCVGDVIIRCKNATVQAESTVKVDVPSAQFTGNVQVDGTVTANGMTSNGNVQANGDIESSGAMKAGGQVEALSGTPGVVRLTTHNHPTAPTGPVSPPTPGT